MTQTPPGPEFDGRNDDHSGLIAALCAILLALALAAIGLFHTPLLNKAERPGFTANVPVAASQPSGPTSRVTTPPTPKFATDTPAPTSPAPGTLTSCWDITTPHFYANDPGKESPKSFGPTLLPAELQHRTSLPAGAEGVRLTNLVVRNFWERLCRDPALANATAITINPHRSITVTHEEQLQFLRDGVDWGHTRLVYKVLGPDQTYTYLMEPGSPPTIKSARYQHGASWFLASEIRDSRKEMDNRTECGGQGVVDEADVSPLVAAA